MSLLNLKNIAKLFLIAAVILISSCQKKAKYITDNTGKTIQIETVVDNQKGNLDSTLNYCFYLPKNYNGTLKLPIVFFLDPHANGKLPVTTYAELANKYGYVFVASNNIKNGEAANYSFQIFQNLVAETKYRFSIDETRMFTSGFSGGAKLSIIFAQQMPEIIGVAACGGSLPVTADYETNYYYAGIVGNEDFNYLETHQTFSLFDQKGFDYTSEIFNGGHKWPPVANYEMALIGFEIYAMKTKRTEKDDKWIDQIWQKMNDSIALYDKNKQILKQRIYIKQAERWFNGLKNTIELKKQAYQIENSIAFTNEVTKQQKLIQTEVKLRSEFIRAIEMRDLAWWELEIDKIKKSTQQNDKDVAQVSYRLMNYLSMASFMLVKGDLVDSRLDNAIKKLKIYELVDPKNPDVYLMYANYYMQLNDFSTMKQEFKKAQELGFHDFNTYKNDSFWKSLFSKTEILELM